MGLAASQARYLALTARKSDLEYQSQTINSRRIQLAYKTAEIAREYSDGMNNSRIKIAKAQIGKDGTTQNVWEEATFSNLLSEGYMVIGAEGTELNPHIYEEDSRGTCSGMTAKMTDFDESCDDSTNAVYARTISAAVFNALTKKHPDIKYFYEAVDKTAYEKDKAKYTGDFRLILSINEVDNKDNYKKMTDCLKNWPEQYPNDAGIIEFAKKYKQTLTHKDNWHINQNYRDKKGADLQSLLVSGKAQIVTKAFFDYMVNRGYYSPTTGLAAGYDFQTIMQEWENNEQYNSAHQKSVIDWRSDETETFASRTYTEDDEKVLAKYEAETAKVQAQDKQLEIEEKNIETQHKAIETEMENVKKVIQKNIEDTFKIFS